MLKKRDIIANISNTNGTGCTLGLKKGGLGSGPVLSIKWSY